MDISIHTTECKKFEFRALSAECAFGHAGAREQAWRTAVATFCFLVRKDTNRMDGARVNEPAGLTSGVASDENTETGNNGSTEKCHQDQHQQQ